MTLKCGYTTDGRKGFTGNASISPVYEVSNREKFAWERIYTIMYKVDIVLAQKRGA